jgi:hypothetical protein
MSEIENPYLDASQISSEVTRALIGLGIDWKSESSLRAIAREALAYKHGSGAPLAADDIQGHTRQRLFGLIALMLRTMQEGADLGASIHGNDAWKALAKALWAEKESGQS